MDKTHDARRILDRVAGKDPGFEKWAEQETINMEVAQLIFDARSAAGLTQKELADKIGSQQPVIARLEDADYRGHSLTMLKRIAKVLGKRVQIRLVPDQKKRTVDRAAAGSKASRRTKTR
jgi:ribosome-binding protein aMBF1 (putative translation factor)